MSGCDRSTAIMTTNDGTRRGGSRVRDIVPASPAELTVLLDSQFKIHNVERRVRLGLEPKSVESRDRETCQRHVKQNHYRSTVFILITSPLGTNQHKTQ